MAPEINEQFEADREQIIIMKKAIEGLYTMVASHDTSLGDMQQQVDGMQRLDHDSRQRHRDAVAAIEDVHQKLMTAGTVTQKSFDAICEEFKGKPNITDDSDMRMSIQARIQKIELELRTMNATITSRVGRESEVENYLQQFEGQRPQEGQAVMQAFKHLYAELENVKATMAQRASATAIGINTVASTHNMQQKGMADDELARLNDMEAKINTITAGNVPPTLFNHWQHIEQTQQRVLALEARVDAVSVTAGVCGGGFAAASPGMTQGCGCPGGCSPNPPGIPGRPGGSADGLPAFVTVQYSRNGVCHCHHVLALERRVSTLERAPPTPAQPPRDRQSNFVNMFGGRGPTGDAGEERRQDGSPPTLEPLGPLGLLNNPEKQLYDDKRTAQSEYKFDGYKGGVAWKSRLERYLMSKVPALKQFLK